MRRSRVIKDKIMNKVSKFIYYAICYVFFIFTDLYLSNILVDNITHGMNISNPVFSLNYVKNTGAAFSILQDSRELLIILSMIALVLLTLHVINHLKSISLKTSFFIALLSAGIAGNLHERIIYGFVRDYFQLNFVNFPVFNISDIFINIGVIALIVMILLKRK
jgi:signal peptidase II